MSRKLCFVTAVDLLRKQTISRFMAVSGLVLLGSVVSGCATTDDLYADYDVNSCPVIASATPARVVLRDRVTSKNMHWEPAVYFEFDRDDLNAIEHARLDKDLLVLKRYPMLRVAVRGFTDHKGGEEYNKALAKRRVATVSAYLEAKGLNPSRMESVALGEGLPILDQTDNVARSIHRRVELLLLDGTGRPLSHELDIRQSPVLAAAKSKDHALSNTVESNSGNVAKVQSDGTNEVSSELVKSGKKLPQPHIEDPSEAKDEKRPIQETQEPLKPVETTHTDTRPDSPVSGDTLKKAENESPDQPLSKPVPGPSPAPFSKPLTREIP